MKPAMVASFDGVMPRPIKGKAGSKGGSAAMPARDQPAPDSGTTSVISMMPAGVMALAVTKVTGTVSSKVFRGRGDNRHDIGCGHGFGWRCVVGVGKIVCSGKGVGDECGVHQRYLQWSWPRMQYPQEKHCLQCWSWTL